MRAGRNGTQARPCYQYVTWPEWTRRHKVVMACACKILAPASPEVAGSQGGFADILRLERLQGVLPGTICISVGSTLSFPQHCYPLRPTVICLHSKSAFCLETVMVSYRICTLVFILFPTRSASHFPSSICYLLKQLSSRGSCPLPDVEHRHQILSSGGLVTPSLRPT